MDIQVLFLYCNNKNKLPKKLKMSPVAIVPHKSFKFRTILDLFSGSSSYTATAQLAPAEAMAQLGNCIKRLVATIADNKVSGSWTSKMVSGGWVKIWMMV